MEGKNILIEYGLAERKLDRLPVVAAELVGLKVDIIVAAGGTEPALAAKKATKTIPIVFTSVADPISAGLVESLARPGGNITGLSNIAAELSGKRLELLKETNPKFSRVAVLWNPEIQNLTMEFKESHAAARALGFSSNRWRCEVLRISRAHLKPQPIGVPVLFSCPRGSFLRATEQSWPSLR